MAIVTRQLASGKSSYHVVISVGGRKVWTHANNKRHATELNSELLVKARNNQLPTMRDITFSNLVERYFIDGVHDLRAQTIASYRSKATNHLLPFLGSLKVRRGCSVERLNTWLSWCRNRGTTDTSTRAAFTVLSAILSYGVRIGLLTENPAHKVRPPKTSNGGVDAVLAPEQVALVISNTPKSERSFMTFLFLTGCRPNEASEIRFRDVNLSSRTVTVSRTAIAGKGNTNGTKTHNSRVIPLSQTLMDAVSEQRRTVYNGEDSLVFPAPRGGRRSMARFARDTFRPALVRSGLNSEVPEGSRSLYLARKSYCSILLNQGIPITTVAKWSGNSPSILAKHYARVRDEQGQAAMAVLDASLRPVTDINTARAKQA